MTQEELDAFTDLQQAYNELSKMYETLRDDMIKIQKANKHGAVFMFKDNIQKFVPIFGEARGITSHGLRPYKFMLTFSDKEANEWMQQCVAALDKNAEPDKFIPTNEMPPPPPRAINNTEGK